MMYELYLLHVYNKCDDKCVYHDIKLNRTDDPFAVLADITLDKP